jgi:hypothetical protein
MPELIVQLFLHGGFGWDGHAANKSADSFELSEPIDFARLRAKVEGKGKIQKSNGGVIQAEKLGS